MQVVGREGNVVLGAAWRQDAVIEEILTGVIARHRRTIM